MNPKHWLLHIKVDENSVSSNGPVHTNPENTNKPRHTNIQVFWENTNKPKHTNIQVFWEKVISSEPPF